MDDEHNQTTEAMMDVDGEEEDSGIASNESGSRRDSLSSMASMSSTATSSNDPAIGSMSQPPSSTSSNASSMSGMSDLSRSSRNSGHSSAGYPNGVSSSRRSSVTSVQSDDSTTTLRNDVTATSMKSERPQTAGLIGVWIKDHNNKTHNVRVRLTDNVKDLKVKVQEKLKIAPSQQRLQFQGKNLDDQSTSSLKCLGLHDSCTVRLHMRTLGGALFSTT